MVPAEQHDDSETRFADLEVPLCLGCLAPVSHLDYACPFCGHSAGQFTPNLPFEGIRFYAEFMGALWDRFWFQRHRPLLGRLFCGVFVILYEPRILVTLPFTCIAWWRRRAPSTIT